jgi:hypothetical protein
MELSHGDGFVGFAAAFADSPRYAKVVHQRFG